MQLSHSRCVCVCGCVVHAVDPAALATAGPALAAAVDVLAGHASARLLAQMRGPLALPTHLAALKRFLLLGQGDFAEALMRLAWYAHPHPMSSSVCGIHRQVGRMRA
jgi:hypothetical protein